VQSKARWWCSEGSTNVPNSRKSAPRPRLVRKKSRLGSRAGARLEPCGENVIWIGGTIARSACEQGKAACGCRCACVKKRRGTMTQWNARPLSHLFGILGLCWGRRRWRPRSCMLAAPHSHSHSHLTASIIGITTQTLLSILPTSSSFVARVGMLQSHAYSSRP
jgi:hypothetical protein